MASIQLPSSWDLSAGNGHYIPLRGALLAQLNAITGWPLAEGIPWYECVDSQGENDARFSGNQLSAAEAYYWTIAPAVLDYQVLPILMTAVLGGYNPTDDKKYPPLPHPYLPMVAKDVVGIDMFAPSALDTGNPAFPFETYSLARLKVSYESLGYAVCCAESGGSCTGPASGGNALWMNNIVQGSNSRITQLFGLYKLDRGGGLFFPIQLGLQLPRPEGIIRQTFYRVPVAWVNPGLSTLIAAQGKINNAPYLGFGAEKVLLDSYQVSPTWYDWWGRGIVNVTLNFIYVDWGWNNQPDPFAPGTLLPVVANDGVTQPFTSINMDSLPAIFSPIAKMVPCN